MHDNSSSLALQVVDGEVRLAVWVQPRARSSAVAGMIRDALKVRLTAPPVEGAANAALIALLPERLGVPRSAIRILTGSHARRKLVGVRGLSADAVQRRLVPM